MGNLAPWILQAIVFGLAFGFFLPGSSELQPTLGWVLLGAVSVLIANLLYFLMRIPLQFVAFWQDNVWSLSVGLRMIASLLGGVLIPLSLWPETAQGVLRWLPFGALFDLPARTVLGEISLSEWFAQTAIALGWCVVLAWVARAVWRRGQRGYAGVGI